MSTPHLTTEQMHALLPEVRRSPRSSGTLDLIVRRPAIGEREVVEEGVLDLAEGLVGDNWKVRGSKKTKDGSAHPEMQLNVTGRRFLQAIARTEDRWQLAGDQLVVDFDLSIDNLPPGTRLAVGKAIIEVTSEPHTGCKKYAQRFGVEAVKFVNSPDGKHLRLRGLNAKVVVPGTIRRGNTIEKL